MIRFGTWPLLLVLVWMTPAFSAGESAVQVETKSLFRASAGGWHGQRAQGYDTLSSPRWTTLTDRGDGQNSHVSVRFDNVKPSGGEEPSATSVPKELMTSWFVPADDSCTMLLRGLVPGKYSLVVHVSGGGTVVPNIDGKDTGTFAAAGKTALGEFTIGVNARSIVTVSFQGRNLRIHGLELTGTHLLPKPPPPKTYKVVPVADHKAVEYFVDPAGSDDNPGSLERPFKTPARASAVAVMGDTVTFRVGDYGVDDNTSLILPVHCGMEDRWITYRAFPGEKVVLFGVTTDRMEAAGHPQQYLRFVNLVFDGHHARGNGILTTDRCPVDHIEFLGCEFRNYTNKGIRLRAAANAKATNVLVQDCEIHHIKGPGVDGEWLLDSRFVRVLSHDNDDGKGEDGDADGFTLQGNCRNIEFVDCDAWSCSEDGFDSKAKQTRLTRCRVWKINSVPFKLWNDETLLVNCTSVAAGTRSEEHLRLSGTAEGAKFSIYNCTFVGGQMGIKLRQNDSQATLIVRNTIFAGMGTPIAANSFRNMLVSIDSDHNLYCPPVGKLPPAETGFVERANPRQTENPGPKEIRKSYKLAALLNSDKARDLFKDDKGETAAKRAWEDPRWPAVLRGALLDGAWAKDTGNDKHSILVHGIENIGFLDLKTMGLHLKASSPALGAGTWIEGFTQTDLDGRDRPKDKVDIGAYQY